MRSARPAARRSAARSAPLLVRSGLLRALALAGALAPLVPLAGCVQTPPAVGGYATDYAESVPPDIYAYPHVWYDGGYAYLVGERWYYPSRSGWVVLRAEPAPLHRYRAEYRIRGWPGYGRTYPQAAPPAYGPSYPRPAERAR
jgi:hypothetical protein